MIGKSFSIKVTRPKSWHLRVKDIEEMEKLTTVICEWFLFLQPRLTVAVTSN